MNRLKRLDEIVNIAKELKESGAVFSIKDLQIDGNDIISAGADKGPEVGRILDMVFACYLDEKCRNTRESLLGCAEEIMLARKKNS